MTTYNLTINTGNWVKVVDATDTDFLITWDVARVVEFASTSVEVAPTIQGHRIPREKIVTREDVGAGFVWAKLVTGGSGNAIKLTVSKSNSTSGATGGFDSVEGVQKVAMLVWNPSSLQWERSSTTSGGGNTEATVTTKRIDKRNATELYVGTAAVGTSESAASWNIQKITFDESGNATAVLQGIGTWNNRYFVVYS